MSKNMEKRLTPLDIIAVVRATRLQKSFSLVVNLRRRMELLACSKAGIITTAILFLSHYNGTRKNVSSEKFTL